MDHGVAGFLQGAFVMTEDVSKDQRNKAPPPPEDQGLVITSGPPPDVKRRTERALGQRNRSPLAALMGRFVAALSRTAEQGAATSAQAHQPASRQDIQSLASTVFTVPKNQSVAFATEIPGGAKGVTNEDSYLYYYRRLG
jgi:hypothetical protein